MAGKVNCPKFSIFEGQERLVAFSSGNERRGGQFTVPCGFDGFHPRLQIKTLE